MKCWTLVNQASDFCFSFSHYVADPTCENCYSSIELLQLCQILFTSFDQIAILFLKKYIKMSKLQNYSSTSFEIFKLVFVLFCE